MPKKGTSLCKDKKNLWQAKCLAARKELKKYKRKSACQAAQIYNLRAQLRLCPKPSDFTSKSDHLERPIFHSYPLLLMSIAIVFQVHDNLSFRQVSSVLGKIIKAYGYKMKVPCANTIRHWVRKCAYYYLLNRPINPNDRYVVILDESAAIGKEKLLLTIGINEASWHKQPSALTFEEVTVLDLRIGSSSKSDEISHVLKDIRTQIPKGVSHVVSDQGSTIVAGIRKAEMVHVTECTHYFSLLMERYYKKSEAFIALQSGIGKLRQKWVNGANTHAAPPNMRTKSRFLNLYDIIDWLDAIRTKRHQLSATAQQDILFIDTHEELIEELIAILNLVKKVSLELKNNGITLQTSRILNGLIKAQSYGNVQHAVDRFNKDVDKYVEQIRLLLPNTERVMCCSDVIESLFGKYKYRGNNGTSTGITDDAMVISLFGKKELPELKQAMELNTVADVKKWVDANMPSNFKKDRKKFMQKLEPEFA